MARVALLQNIWYEFLGGMALIAELRRAGHEAQVFIGKDAQLLREVRAYAPDIVGFSCVTGYHHWALAMAKKVRQALGARPLIVMGGPHATFFPEVVEREPLDAICRGEGEGAFLDLCAVAPDREAAAKIANLWVKTAGGLVKNPVRPLIEDLDSLPMLERESFYRYRHLRTNPVKRLITGRGCPFACTFCFNHSLQDLYRGQGRYVRKRSVGLILEELCQIRDRYPVKTFCFEDDIFALDRAWLSDFLDRYPGTVRRPFICFVRADLVDEEMVRDLKGAGCYNVVFGVESGDEQIRNTVLKKGITDEVIHRAAALFKRYDLNFCTTNMLGLPHETPAQAERTVTFNLELKPRFVWCAVFQPYPRTELGEMVVREGLTGPLDVDAIDANYHNRSVLRQPGIHVAENLHKFFYLAFFFPWLFPVLRRLARLRPNPVFLLLHRLSFMFIFRRRWDVSLWRALLEGLRSGGFSRHVEERAGE